VRRLAQFAFEIHTGFDYKAAVSFQASAEPQEPQSKPFCMFCVCCAAILAIAS